MKQVLFDEGDYSVTVKELTRLGYSRSPRGYAYWKIRLDFEIDGLPASMYLLGFTEMERMLWELREHIVGRKILIRNKRGRHPHDVSCLFNDFSFRGFL